MIALRFFATGSYQMDIGQNLTLCVSQPSVSRCIHEVINAANEDAVMNKWINLPSTAEGLTQLRNEYVYVYLYIK